MNWPYVSNLLCSVGSLIEANETSSNLFAIFSLLFYGILWRNAIRFVLDGWGELYTSITPQKKGLEDCNSGRKVDFFAVMAALCEGAHFLGIASLHVPETHHNEECLERNSSDFAGS